MFAVIVVLVTLLGCSLGAPSRETTEQSVSGDSIFETRNVLSELCALGVLNNKLCDAAKGNKQIGCEQSVSIFNSVLSILLDIHGAQNVIDRVNEVAKEVSMERGENMTDILCRLQMNKILRMVTLSLYNGKSEDITTQSNEVNTEIEDNEGKK